MTDNSPHKPNLELSDFQNTLEGSLPGNTAAEHGNLAGAAPDSVTTGQTPDDVKLADPAELSRQREEFAERIGREADEQRARQIAEYEAGATDGKQP